MDIMRIQNAFNALLSTIRDEVEIPSVDATGNNDIAFLIADALSTINPDDGTAQQIATNLAFMFHDIAESY
jgi:ketosteroid isomerase-like protein